MSRNTPANVVYSPELHNRTQVFRDRAYAGRILADLLAEFRRTKAQILAVPAGGVPVATAMAERLHLPLDVAIVSKVTLPWNTEAGYGAVAFDGTVRLNRRLLARVALSEDQVQQGIVATRAKVKRRVKRFRGGEPLPELAGRPIILVDDGLASGFTMEVAVEALKHSGADRVIVAVPTGHGETVRRLASAVETLYCANIREGLGFAVADAYEHWSDVAEDEAIETLKAYRDAAATRVED